jgi:RNA polymerase sigma-70 factor (ECF subfamily)
MTDPFDGARLAQALRTGQPDPLRAAFDRHIDAMTLFARSLAGGSDAAASRLVEAAWTSVLADFARNPPRGSARAWLFARLLELRDPALDTGALAPDDPDGPEFLPADDPWEGHWTDFPEPWRPASDGWESSAAGRTVVGAAVATLPLAERVVLILRDLDGWTPSEVGALTGLLPDEERDVLFLARLKVRAAMDPLLRAEPSPAPITEEAGTSEAAETGEANGKAAPGVLDHG